MRFEHRLIISSLSTLFAVLLQIFFLKVWGFSPDFVLVALVVFAWLLPFSEFFVAALVAILALRSANFLEIEYVLLLVLPLLVHVFAYTLPLRSFALIAFSGISITFLFYAIVSPQVLFEGFWPMISIVLGSGFASVAFYFFLDKFLGIAQDIRS